MLDTFKEKVIALAVDSVKKAPNCRSEQSVNMFLLMPFISLLGYDVSDPGEVSPEHHADFSEKYKNRVDFAIIKDGDPMIAFESKGVGAKLKDDRGQLRSYFNACPTIKLGILTDGLVYEFYADSNEPNMMDQSAFLTLDMTTIASGNIEDNALETLHGFQKSSFDPENIGAEAKRKHIFQAVMKHLSELADQPTEAFVRMMLQAAGVTHLRAKAIEEFTPLIEAAFVEFINQRIMQRLSIPSEAKLVERPKEKPTIEPEETAIQGDPKIITTETELAVFDYAKQKLAFLVSSEAAFKEIEHVAYRDYQAKFVVFYKKERKGRLFDFAEMANGDHRFTMADGEMITVESGGDWSAIDAKLLEVFSSAVGDGIPA